MKPQDQQNQSVSQTTARQSTERPQVIATRKTCDATGTGLSHYVLMDKEVRR